MTRLHRPPILYTLICVALLLAPMTASCSSAPLPDPKPMPAPPDDPAPLPPPNPPAPTEACPRTVTARVVALDQPFFFNRLGVAQPGGMIYALERDVVSTDADPGLTAGAVALRADKRPRPIVLRANQDDCLKIHFTNLLSDKSVWEQPATRWSGVHIVGMSLVAAYDADGAPLEGIQADGSWVGVNPPSIVPPGGKITYVYKADQPGSFFLHSSAGSIGFEEESDTFDLQYPSGQMTAGLFGAVNVQPRGAVWFRSQVSAEDFAAATTGKATAHDLPVIDYYATYPEGTPNAGMPVLAMLDQSNEIIYSDLTAIVAYQEGGLAQPGPFPDDPSDPQFMEVPASPDRTQPFREITIIYHQAFSITQAFDCVYAPPVNPATGERDYSLCKEEYAQEMTPYLFDALGVGEDRYAINYASGGIGSEILANRLGVGPAGSCLGCKYEEFFLSSWPNGDPGQVVTIPAAAAAALDTVNNLPRSMTQKALYPDDPSAVYHSYIRDHVKYRVLQGAANFHHLHHQHAHQWLHTPNAATGHYLDSQAIGPGTSFTLEMVYNGSGNRNETVGDSIFHCHFYPHFAEGMWSLWRVHDVLEAGTEMAADGLPKAAKWKDGKLVEPGARALPDGEIARGTPIPAVVPLPARPMPRMPAKVTLSADGKEAHTLVRDGGRWQILTRDTYDPDRDYANPGYPFFIPGKAGQRTVRPPLDVAWASTRTEGGRTILDRADKDTPGAILLDGGLPRSLITGSGDPDGPGSVETHTRLDFSKVLLQTDARRLEEAGEPAEKIAMRAHARAEHPSCLPDGTCEPGTNFILNGLPRIAGAPYADPCGPEDGVIVKPDGSPLTRHYRGANIQLDVVFNKEGWHFPQQRIITLWDDVEPTLSGERPPQPLFFRANSGECIEYWQANLVRSEYALDDFQVRTPTDILGQHIHLVKFDVTSSDGAANGWNYEDGSLSPDEVRERIDSINAAGGILGFDGKREFLEAKIHPRFGPGPGGTWIGAQTTVQRWMADPLRPGIWADDDRTIRTVFTHDHFSPSTHQQAGLYAGLLVEPEGSMWRDSWSGEIFGGQRGHEQVVRRPDGGPTHWRADILAQGDNGRDLSFREFALEFQDMALAYPQSSIAFPDPLAFGSVSIDPDLPPPFFNTQISEIVRPLGQSPIPPWPQVISSGPTIGTYSVNYRNEPLSQRLADRGGFAPPDTWHVAEAQDFAHVFRSIPRLRPEQNVQPPWYPPLTGGVGGYDPYTPLLETYEGDRVQVRTLVGAHEIIHHFTLRGISWLAEPSFLDSGYRNHQVMGISEHFEMQFTVPPNPTHPERTSADYLYLTDASLMGTSRGTWGIMRSYDLDEEKEFLEPLPNNPVRRERQKLSGIEYCSPESRADPRRYSIFAIDVQSFDPGSITYMPEALVKVAVLDDDGSVKSIEDVKTPILGHEGLVYFHEQDVAKGKDGKWRYRNPEAVFEPLVLRAAAGECIEVTLTNQFDKDAGAFNYDTPGDRNPCSIEYYKKLRENPHDFVASFQADNRCVGGNKASTWAGLYPQLVAFDPLRSGGYNVGQNPVVTPAAAGTGFASPTRRTYHWYAGKVEWDDAGAAVWTPVEFGSANLLPADPIHQHSKGLYGALVIEPEGATWHTDPNTRISATVTKPDGSQFREFVMIPQDDFEISWLLPKADDPAHDDDPGGASGDEFEPVPIVSAEAITSVNYSMAFMLFRLAPPAPWSISVGLDPQGNTEIGIYDQTAVDQTVIQVDQYMGGDPPTPVYTAHAGTPVRFRVVHPGGIFESHLFDLHGHGWQERPYVHVDNPSNPTNDPYRAIAQRIGDNEVAEWKGQQIGVGPDSHWDFVIEPTRGVPTNGAGGSQRVPGDYLYRSIPAVFFEGGFWGIFRVGPEIGPRERRDVIAVTGATRKGVGEAAISGRNSPVLGTKTFADSVALYAGTADASGGCSGTKVADVAVPVGQGPMREWSWQGSFTGDTVCARSTGGGSADSALFDSSTPPMGNTRVVPAGTK